MVPKWVLRQRKDIYFSSSCTTRWHLSLQKALSGPSVPGEKPGLWSFDPMRHTFPRSSSQFPKVWSWFGKETYGSHVQRCRPASPPHTAQRASSSEDGFCFANAKSNDAILHPEQRIHLPPMPFQAFIFFFSWQNRSLLCNHGFSLNAMLLRFIHVLWAIRSLLSICWALFQLRNSSQLFSHGLWGCFQFLIW